MCYYQCQPDEEPNAMILIMHWPHSVGFTLFLFLRGAGGVGVFFLLSVLLFFSSCLISLFFLSAFPISLFLLLPCPVVLCSSFLFYFISIMALATITKAQNHTSVLWGTAAFFLAEMTPWVPAGRCDTNSPYDKYYWLIYGYYFNSE